MGEREGSQLVIGDEGQVVKIASISDVKAKFSGYIKAK